jgi:uroporphyrin-III C-methyltransferase
MSDTGKPTDEIRDDEAAGPATEPQPAPERQAPDGGTPPAAEPQVIVQRKSGFGTAVAIIFSLLALAACAYLWLEIERLDSESDSPDPGFAALADEQRSAFEALRDEQQSQLAAFTDQLARLDQRVDEAANVAPSAGSDQMPVELEDLIGRLDALENQTSEQMPLELEDLIGRLDALENSSADTEAAMQALAEQVTQAESAEGFDPALLDDLNERIEQAEAAASAAPQPVAVPVNQDFALEEIESYLRVANRQLQLAGNFAAAETALGLADERLAQLDDPAFLGVRSEIADEIAALQRVQQPDLTGIALALSALSEQASGLALKGHERVAPATAPDQTNAAAGSQSGWDRFVASVQAALKGLVAVRRTDSAVEPLLPPDEVYFLYRNLELKLEVARLALLQRNQEVYRTSLRGVRSWLNTYFDTQDGSVANALSQIADLEGKQIAPTLPDISGSLQQLQQVEPGADGEADADAI